MLKVSSLDQGLIGYSQTGTDESANSCTTEWFALTGRIGLICRVLMHIGVEVEVPGVPDGVGLQGLRPLTWPGRSGRDFPEAGPGLQGRPPTRRRAGAGFALEAVSEPRWVFPDLRQER